MAEGLDGGELVVGMAVGAEVFGGVGAAAGARDDVVGFEEVSGVASAAGDWVFVGAPVVVTGEDFSSGSCRNMLWFPLRSCGSA
jgi:hypothetical protein